MAKVFYFLLFKSVLKQSLNNYFTFKVIFIDRSRQWHKYVFKVAEFKWHLNVKQLKTCPCGMQSSNSWGMSTTPIDSQAWTSQRQLWLMVFPTESPEPNCVRYIVNLSANIRHLDDSKLQSVPIYWKIIIRISS